MNRNISIDYLRVLAALLVVFYHYLFRGHSADGMQATVFNSGLAMYGYLGVDLFFIISGYVIAFSINNRTWEQFMISRIIRLYPTYWLSVLVTYVVLVLYGHSIGLKTLVINMTMFQDVFGVESIDGVYWSLLVEMKFYILIMFTIKILRIRPIIFSIIWFVISGILNYFPDENFIKDLLQWGLITKWSNLFIFGLIINELKQGDSKMFVKIFAVLIAINIITSGVARSEGIGDIFNVIYNELYVALALGTFICLFAFFAFNDVLPHWRIVKVMAGLSYPLYLTHQMIGYKLIDTFSTLAGKHVALVGVVSFVLVLSFLLSSIGETITKHAKLKLMDHA